MAQSSSTRGAPAPSEAIGALSPRHRILGGFAAFCPIVGLVSARGMATFLIVGALALLLAKPRSLALSPLRSAIVALGSLALLAAASIFWSTAPEISRLQTLQVVGIAIPGLLVIGTCLGIGAKPAAPMAPPWLPFGFAFAACVLLAEQLSDFPLYRLLHLLPAATEVESYVHNKAATALAVLLFPALLTQTGDGTANSGFGGTSRQAALAAFALLAILATPSQSALLAATGGLIVLVAARWREKPVRNAIVYVSIAAAVAAPAIALLLPPDAATSLGWLPYSAAQRVEIWRHVGQTVAEHPLLGIGMDGARHALSIAPGSIRGSLHPHNVFLQVWLELGVIGVAWLVGFLLFVGSLIGRMPVEARPYADAALAAAVLVSSFAWGIWQTWWIATLFVTVALLVAATGSAFGKVGSGGDAAARADAHFSESRSTHQTAG